MKLCPFCQTSLEDEAAFCGACAMFVGNVASDDAPVAHPTPANIAAKALHSSLYTVVSVLFCVLAGLMPVFTSLDMARQDITARDWLPMVAFLGLQVMLFVASIGMLKLTKRTSLDTPPVVNRRRFWWTAALLVVGAIGLYAMTKLWYVNAWPPHCNDAEHNWETVYLTAKIAMLFAMLAFDVAVGLLGVRRMLSGGKGFLCLSAGILLVALPLLMVIVLPVSFMIGLMACLMAVWFIACAIEGLFCDEKGCD